MKSSLNKYKLLVSKSKPPHKFQNYDNNNPLPLNYINNRIRHNNPANFPQTEKLKDVELELHPGDEAPLGYLGKKHFPDWYKPYSYNYYGNGFLLLGFATLTYVCYIQHERYLKNTGRSYVHNHRDEHNIFMSVLLFRRLAQNIMNMKEQPVISYTERYIKESGF